MASATKTPKGAPFSIRLSKPTELYVENEARRTRRSKSAIVEDLTEEAARMRRFPGIGFREGGNGTRRAWVRGTGFDVWEMVETLRDFDSADSLLKAFEQLTKNDIELGLAYYREYPAEIDEAIAQNQRPLDDYVRLYPFIKVEYVDAES